MLTILNIRRQGIVKMIKHGEYKMLFDNESKQLFGKYHYGKN